MIQNEFGFDEVLKTILNIEDISKAINEKNKYLEGTIEHLKLSQSAQDKIANYLTQKTNTISIQIFNAIMAINAYMKRTPLLESAIHEYIQKNYKELINQLDVIIINKVHINMQSSQYYTEIMDAKLSCSLLVTVSSLSIHSPRLFKIHEYFGLQHLVMELSLLFHDEFSSWYFNTKREDLKLIFAATAFDSFYVFSFSSSILSQSDIVFIRVLSLLIEYKLDRNLTLKKESKTFVDLNPNIPEHIYFILYSYKYRRLDRTEEKNVTQFNEELKSIHSHIQHLTVDILKEYFYQIDNQVLSSILTCVDNEDVKEELISALINSLDQKLEHSTNLDEYDVKDANTYAFLILHSKNTQYIQIIEKNYIKLCNQLNTPYYYYRNNEHWESSMKQLLYYLIIIFILYAKSDYNKIKTYKQLYKETKRDFYFYNEDDMQKILEQIRKI